MPPAEPTEVIRLPMQIDPCPIVGVTAEVRFQTTLPPQGVAGVVYAAVRDEFPKMLTLPGASIPPEVCALDPNLKYQAHYRLEGERGAVFVGPQNVGIEPRNVPYPGWPHLQTEFDSIFERLVSPTFITTVERFGLRYINFFDEDILPRLTLLFTIEDVPVTGLGTFFRALLPEAGCKLLVQVASGVALQSDTSRVGSVIDIDSFVEFPQPTNDVRRGFGDFLSVAHRAEKGLFFRLLKPELLASLNPVYA